jgi:hypothetical protein
MKARILAFFNREPARREKILFWVTIGCFVVFSMGSTLMMRNEEKGLLRKEAASLEVERRSYEKLTALAQKSGRGISPHTGVPLTIDEVFNRLEKSSLGGEPKGDEAFEWLVSSEMRAGAKLLLLERGAREDQEQYATVPIVLRMSGSPRQMVLYLEALEALPQLLFIESLRVSEHPQGKSLVEWELKLSLYFGNKQIK